MSAEIGTCTITRWTDGATLTDRIRIDRADPRVRVSADLLQEISIATARGEDRYASLVDDVLTLRGDNRTVIYRIFWDQWDCVDDTYYAEWPD